MFNFLGEAVLPNWVSNSFPIIKFILLIIIALCAIGIIAVVLMQESEDNSSNAITGIKETYYSQNKGANREGRLKKATIILAVAIAVLVIVYFTLDKFVPSNIWSSL